MDMYVKIARIMIDAKVLAVGVPPNTGVNLDARLSAKLAPDKILINVIPI